MAALALLKNLEWTAALVGSDQADLEYEARVRAAVTDNGLALWIRLTGELLGEALERAWGAADLGLLVSQAEAFGMVVTGRLPAEFQLWCARGQARWRRWDWPG
ncbi:hypothetical protein ACLH0K_03775 [Arthrobacter sp. MPF02]|uniref:hypothetical protein n=1 Tax=Arthrobacter sp. MPF02 TaxID=3388492 RepID=UPI003984A48D